MRVVRVGMTVGASRHTEGLRRLWGHLDEVEPGG